jgi:DNA polymerase-1
MLDLEVRELDWARGPGWARGKSQICGVAIGAYDGVTSANWYYPIHHTVEPEYNCNPDNVLNWLRDTLNTPIPVIGANLLYDFGTLSDVDIYPRGRVYDCQYAQALIDEESPVNLDYLGQVYCGVGKETNVLYNWLRTAYGELGETEYDQRKNIYRASPRLAGPYAQRDCELPLRVLQTQWPILERDGLLALFEMECKLIPLLVKMRKQGVKVDIDATERLYIELGRKQQEIEEKIKQLVGFYVGLKNSREKARAFDVLGLSYQRTAKSGEPSFTKDFLKTVDHPIAKLLLDASGLYTLRNTFLKHYILEGHSNGRLHTQFHPLKNDTDGTGYGRFSSSDPNLQNIPARSHLGKMVRSCFIPFSHNLCWEKNDYSQIEYRNLVHFAVGEGSDNVRLRYCQEPRTDYHKLTQSLVLDTAGITIPRNAEEAAKGDGRFGTLTIKEINFGLLYGMGEGKLAKMAGIDARTSKALFEAYHRGNPYISATMAYFVALAQAQGYVQDIGGRRSHFNLWEPSGWQNGERRMPLPYPQALAQYGHQIVRAKTYVAVNRVLQGSAATELKAGMVQCYEQGLFDITGVPVLTVHDELDFSVIDDSPERKEAHAEVRRVMETAVPLKIPVRIDSSRGANWGEC